MDRDRLKVLRNSMIGHTPTKSKSIVEGTFLTVIQFLTLDNDAHVIKEAATIISTLANVGTLIPPPILIDTFLRLLHLVTTLVSHDNEQHCHLLPHLLGALRNVVKFAAGMDRGNRQLAADKQVVGSGFLGEDIYMSAANLQRDRCLRMEVKNAIDMPPCQLMSLVHLFQCEDDRLLLPLYQLFSGLMILPFYSNNLVSFVDPPPIPCTMEMCSFNRGCPAAIERPPLKGPVQLPFIVKHLLVCLDKTVQEKAIFRINTRLTGARLTLLADIAKCHRCIAVGINGWRPIAQRGVPRTEYRSVIYMLSALTEDSRQSISLPAIRCSTQLLKAESSTAETSIETLIKLKRQILGRIRRFLQNIDMEGRVELNLALAVLVSDDPVLQEAAFSLGLPLQILSRLVQHASDINEHLLESSFMALASLAMSHDPTRSLISGYSMPYDPSSSTSSSALKVLKQSLRHHTYSVRAAACQLARALSRTVNVVRTGMLDEGVGEEVVRLLNRETKNERDKDQSSLLGDARWAVEIAATATICNLVADLSPFRLVILESQNLLTLVDLTHSSSASLATNALWSIKNLIFHSNFVTKVDIMRVLSYSWLAKIISSSTPQQLTVQGLEIIQNLLAEAPSDEIYKMAEKMGERPDRDLDGNDRIKGFLNMLANILKNNGTYESNTDVQVPALYVLANLAKSSMKLRAAVVKTPAILEALSIILTSEPEPPQVPAILVYHCLIGPPVQTACATAVLELVGGPFDLQATLQAKLAKSKSLSIVRKAAELLEILNVLDRHRR